MQPNAGDSNVEIGSISSTMNLAMSELISSWRVAEHERVFCVIPVEPKLLWTCHGSLDGQICRRDMFYSSNEKRQDMKNHQLVNVAVSGLTRNSGTRRQNINMAPEPVGLSPFVSPICQVDSPIALLALTAWWCHHLNCQHLALELSRWPVLASGIVCQPFAND